MTKPANFLSVQDWIDTQFKVQIGNAKSLNEKTLSFVGKILLEVHPDSPAGYLGLRAGDILYALNGGTFNLDDLEKTFLPRRFGRTHNFEFYRPESHRKIRIKGPTFPFGTSFGQTIESFAVELRNGSPEPSDTSQFWTVGQTDNLATLLPAFEAFNIRMIRQKGAPFDGPLPQNLPSKTELANEDIIWPGHYAWMALCAAHAGQWDRASFILNKVDDHFERSDDSGMMNMFAAMAYTRSMLAEQKGHINDAVSHMQHAIEMSSETRILYSRLSALTGNIVTPPTSRFIGEKPSYKFPRQDPSNRFPQAAGEVTLQESVSRLKSGEFILICIMSSYRVNDPYVAGFQRAMIPLANLRNIFREVHVITSWNHETSHDLALPIMEEKMRQYGIKISVLFDDDQTLSEQIALTSAPTNLIVDHTGHVVAEGWLGDDVILWDALETPVSH